MMNISLMNILLNNWLSDDLLSRSLNSLNSINSVILGLFNNRVHVNGLILLSIKFNLNVLSLNDWLNVSLIVDFFSWSSDSLRS